MSNTREEYLVNSLKNVSLQRLRNLKMDMDRLARDSRIGNDKAFWSLLEFHNIRLDERTKREFYSQVADSRGVNVISAIKNLRRAQRKTGRDSVEVLPKSDSPVLPKENKKIPEATSTSLKIPMRTTGTRNYKLDKFKAKAMGIGKLRATLKMTTPLKAMKGEGNTDQTKTENPKKTGENITSKPRNTEDEPSKPIDSFSNSMKQTSESDIQNKTPSMQDATINITEKAPKDESSDQSKKSSLNNSKPGNFLKLLLEEKEANNLTQNKLDENISVENNNQKSLAKVDGAENKSDDITSQPLVTKTKSSTTSEVFLTKNEPELVDSKDATALTNTSKTSDQDPKDNSSKDFETEIRETNTPPNDTMSSEKKEASCVTDQLIIERTSNNDFYEASNNERRKSEHQGQTTLPSNATENQTDSNENIAKNSQNNDKGIGNVVAEETENSAAVQMISSDSDQKENTDTTPKGIDTSDISIEPQAAAQTETPLDSCIVEISNDVDKNIETTKHDKQDNADFTINDKDLETNQKSLDIPAITPTPVLNDSKLDSTIDNKSSSDNCASNSSAVEPTDMTCNGTALPPKVYETEKSKTADDDKEVEIKEIISKATESLDTVVNEKEKNENSTKLKNSSERKRKRKKKSKMQSEKSSEHKQNDETEKATPKAKAVKENNNTSDTKVLQGVSEVTETTVIAVNVKVKKEDEIYERQNATHNNHLDTCSISSQSSEENNLTLNDALPSSGADVTAKINFGEVSIELSGAEWLDREKNHLDRKDFPRLHVDWVHGCNTIHSQCITSSKNGELIYFVGCVVILYNIIRKSQRHYMEHSSMITSITAHPSDILVASAQEESFKNFNSNLQSQADRYSCCDGSTHVRVWSTITLETMRTIGLGILRSSVYKMKFLNSSNYFITIEHNEECTMTVWDGGCRVTSKSTSFSKARNNIQAPPLNKLSTSKKRFTPTLPTSYKRPQGNQLKTQKLSEENTQLANSKLVNGPKGMAGSFCEELEFVTVGKHHLSFWKLQEADEDGGSPSEEFAISGPEHGDFGETFFRAEYISACLATTKFWESGSIVTGDSNGTILMWSERSKAAIRGYPHAHECYISSMCMSDDGHIFTAGAKDELIKAFTLRKNKIDKCGSIKIPSGQGSATCLVFIERTLFIATEKNLIISVDIEPSTTSSPQISSAAYALSKSTPKLSSRSYSFGSGFHKNPTLPTTKSLQNEPNADTSFDNGIFTKFDTYEVARGFSKGMKHICSLGNLKTKLNNQTDAIPNQVNDLMAVPTAEEGIAMIRQQMAKSAGANKLQEMPVYPSKTVYAWRGNDVNSEQCSPRRPILSASSPRLLTHERVLLKEKARVEDLQKSLPLFSLTNHVTTKEVFFENDAINSSVGDCFVASSADGWLTVYSSQEHTIIGRFKLPPLGKITCVDACPQRHVVVVGTDTGHVMTIRIHLKKFEVLSSLKCRCSGGGSPAIIALQFSPNGKKLAVSIGYDVIILLSKPPLLSEHGRCVGHRSDSISCLDWSKMKYSGTYFLRSCATNPIPEVKTWHTDTLLEVRDITTTMEWATNSCILDYSSKGIWDKYSTPNDVSRLVISAIESNAWTRNAPFHNHASSISNSELIAPSNVKQGINELEMFLCIGDADGRVTTQPYPCLRWKSITTENRPGHRKEHRPHNTAIRNMSASSSGKYLYTTSKDGCAVVQWSIVIS